MTIQHDAQWVNEHYTGDLTVDHRPMTNMEMLTDLRAWRDERERRIAEHGCCGEGRDLAGRCYGYGICPLYSKAMEIIKRHGGED